MDNEEVDLFFGCLMGLVVFFAVVMAILLTTYSPMQPPPPPPINTTELYSRLVRVCNAIDFFNQIDCPSVIYQDMQNRGLMP